MYKVDKDLLSIQEARIHIEAAREAAKELQEFSQAQLDSIVEQMALALQPCTEQLAKAAVDETAYGRMQDKIQKNKFVCECLPAYLKGRNYVGIIQESVTEQLVEIGVPVGTIAAIVPATSPVSTTIHNTLIAIKSGNPIIISPHPRAYKTIHETVSLLAEAAYQAGLPAGGIHCMQLVTDKGTEALIQHEDTALVMVTGVPKLMPLLQTSGKPFIYGGSGNGPAFIERTCNLMQAVEDVITSRTFDYGMVSAAEQSIVVDGPIAESVKAEFKRQGAYFMSESETEAVLAVLFKTPECLNQEAVGQSAETIAAWAHITVPVNTRLLVYEQRYVSESNPLSRELFSPVVAFYIEPNWQYACEKCIELLMESTKSHTLVIHSQDEAVIRLFALKKPVSRVLVNTPSTLGGMGATTNLFPSMTLGSTSLGVAAASDNISPLHLVKVRKVGYGVRKLSDCFTIQEASQTAECTPGIEEVIQQLLLNLE